MSWENFAENITVFQPVILQIKVSSLKFLAGIIGNTKFDDFNICWSLEVF